MCDGIGTIARNKCSTESNGEKRQVGKSDGRRRKVVRLGREDGVLEKRDKCKAGCVEGICKGSVDDCGKGDKWQRFEGRGPERRLRNATLEDLESLAICLDRFWKDNFIYAKGRFVEDDFGLGLWGEINGFVNEEVHQR